MNQVTYWRLPHQMASLDIWWWIFLGVVVCISLKYPMFLLFVLLLAWRAGELWLTWRMIPQFTQPADYSGLRDA